MTQSNRPFNDSLEELFEGCNWTELYQWARKHDYPVRPNMSRQEIIQYLLHNKVHPPAQPHTFDGLRFGMHSFLKDHWNVVSAQLTCPAKSGERRACFNCLDQQITSCVLENARYEKKIRLHIVYEQEEGNDREMTQPATASVNIDNLPLDMEQLSQFPDYKLRGALPALGLLKSEAARAEVRAMKKPDLVKLVYDGLKAYRSAEKMGTSVEVHEKFPNQPAPQVAAAPTPEPETIQYPPSPPPSAPHHVGDVYEPTPVPVSGPVPTFEPTPVPASIPPPPPVPSVLEEGTRPAHTSHGGYPQVQLENLEQRLQSLEEVLAAQNTTASETHQMVKDLWVMVLLMGSDKFNSAICKEDTKNPSPDAEDIGTYLQGIGDKVQARYRKYLDSRFDRWSSALKGLVRKKSGKLYLRQ